MNRKDLINALSDIALDNDKIERIEKEYNTEIPLTIRQIISYAEEDLFFDDGSRILSFSEIMNASDELSVPFFDKHIIPLIDCCDNDFIVYHYDDSNWSMFNIVDEISFKIRATLEELL